MELQTADGGGRFTFQIDPFCQHGHEERECTNTELHESLYNDTEGKKRECVQIGHGLEPPTMHPPPPHFTHTNFFKPLYV